MFEQWGQARYFKSNIFNPVIENRGADHLPYLRIGLDVNTQTDLYLSPSARTVNLEGLGPIGSGKSAALQRPMLRQDAEKIFMYWRDYTKERRKHKTFKSFEKVWFTEERNGQYIKALEILGKLHERQTKDWLGQLTGVASLTENKDGQVFTPDHVAQLMSELVNTTSNIQETVSDPCCGTGALLLGHIARVREKDSKQNIRMHAVDLDRTALLCTFIQCGLHGVNGEFMVGNTLTEEVYETFYSAPIYH
jgi:Type I restriction-modification system methyltransferase subunit